MRGGDGVSKKARADAKKHYAQHVAAGRPVCYPWPASMKPWPVHRLLEVDSRDEYGEKGGLAYQVQFRELFWAEVKELMKNE